MLRLNLSRRYSPERPWAPLSDDEWAVLSPFVHRAADVAGRPVHDPRGRLDAIFWLAANTRPGRAPPGTHSRSASASQAPPRASSAAGPSRACGPSCCRRWPATSAPAPPCSAGSSPGSAAPTAAPSASWACRAWRWPGASVSSRRCAAPPRCCPTPVCPNRSSASSAPASGSPASGAWPHSRPASSAPTTGCWPSPPAAAPSRAASRRPDRRAPVAEALPQDRHGRATAPLRHASARANARLGNAAAERQGPARPSG